MSHLEQSFTELWLEAYPLIDLHSEHRFTPPRRFRFDFAHLPTRIAIEIDGGTWSQGRHSQGTGVPRSCQFEPLSRGRRAAA